MAAAGDRPHRQVVQAAGQWWRRGGAVVVEGGGALVHSWARPLRAQLRGAARVHLVSHQMGQEVRSSCCCSAAPSVPCAARQGAHSITNTCACALTRVRRQVAPAQRVARPAPPPPPLTSSSASCLPLSAASSDPSLFIMCCRWCQRSAVSFSAAATAAGSGGAGAGGGGRAEAPRHGPLPALGTQHALAPTHPCARSSLGLAAPASRCRHAG